MKKKFIGEAEMFFLALADETRLRLLNLMREKEVNVNVFVEILGVVQPKVSRHLAFLRKAGIVDLRRDGKRIHYRITRPQDEYLALILNDTLRWLDSHEQMRRETKEFLKTRRSATEREQPETLNSDVFDQSHIRKYKKTELEIFLL